MWVPNIGYAFVEKLDDGSYEVTNINSKYSKNKYTIVVGDKVDIASGVDVKRVVFTDGVKTHTVSEDDIIRIYKPTKIQTVLIEG